MDALTQQTAAVALTARLATAVLPWRGAPPATATHIPRLLDPSWLRALPLPIGDHRTNAQTVAFTDREGEFQREDTSAGIARAYQERPRTLVYESADVRSDGWYSLTALHLARTLRRRVVCSLYESNAQDRTLGPHDDAWDGLILQLRGAKLWTIWPDRNSDPTELLTEPGDLLLLPCGVVHDVSTPRQSVHAVFAITSHPLASARAPQKAADVQ
ncbi:JmjC domain-containing protein [Streptomyces sp. NPDC020965]|uniref:JmjC domain-containing protein n=1 Tax=Streptomyces sp. NPDC020965 TaxID=3365105 RepID=UPI0037AF3CBA